MRKLRLIKPWQLTTVRQPLSFERTELTAAASVAYQPCMGPRCSEDRDENTPAEPVRCMGPRGNGYDRTAVVCIRL